MIAEILSLETAQKVATADKLQTTADNWNELKEWLQEKAIEKKEAEEISLQYFYVYKKMQELEGNHEQTKKA